MIAFTPGARLGQRNVMRSTSALCPLKGATSQLASPRLCIVFYRHQHELNRSTSEIDVLYMSVVNIALKMSNSPAIGCCICSDIIIISLPSFAFHFISEPESNAMPCYADSGYSRCHTCKIPFIVCHTAKSRLTTLISAQAS